MFIPQMRAQVSRYSTCTLNSTCCVAIYRVCHALLGCAKFPSNQISVLYNRVYLVQLRQLYRTVNISSVWQRSATLPHITVNLIRFRPLFHINKPVISNRNMIRRYTATLSNILAGYLVEKNTHKNHKMAKVR